MIISFENDNNTAGIQNTMNYPTFPIYSAGDVAQKEIEEEFMKYITQNDIENISKKDKIFSEICKDISCEVGKVSIF